MTAKTFVREGNAVKKMPGWFSWRHQTRDAHDAAREAYLAKSGRVARRRRAAERAQKASA